MSLSDTFFMKTLRLVSLILAALVTSNFLAGCASDNGGRRISTDEYHDGSRAHPAAYLVDSFPVDHEFTDNKKGNQVPFYFKRCEQAGEREFYSRTSYDCDYPF
jgi:hypothetical protein